LAFCRYFSLHNHLFVFSFSFSFSCYAASQLLRFSTSYAGKDTNLPFMIKQ
jgi:hypothetical protein